MSDAFEVAWDVVKNEEKRSSNRFKGYSKNRISGRAERAGKARAWSQSRKVKRGRTRRRYARNKSRGNVRPKLRRQLGAGGERIQVKKEEEDWWDPAAEFRKLTGKRANRQRQWMSRGNAGKRMYPLRCIRPNCNQIVTSDREHRDQNQKRGTQCGTCARLLGPLPASYNRDTDSSDVAPT